MMMAQQKYLHELLQEDQEPFQLKNYIADRRIQLKKRQPSNLIKKACFFSFNDSPDPRKSPLFEFPSPVKTKSPCNAIFLNIPARTTALLLEAALRIQNKPKSRTKISLFGSLRRKLITYRTGKKSSCDKEISPCSCDNGRPSSAVWSDKSLDLDVDTSSTSHSSSSITTPAPPSPCRHNFKVSFYFCICVGKFILAGNVFHLEGYKRLFIICLHSNSSSLALCHANLKLMFFHNRTNTILVVSHQFNPTSFFILFAIFSFIYSLKKMMVIGKGESRYRDVEEFAI